MNMRRLGTSDIEVSEISLGCWTMGGLNWQEGLRALQPKLEKLKTRFGSSTEALAAVALNYMLSLPNIGCVIPGFRNERQVVCNLAAQGRTLTEDDLVFIDQTFAE